MDRIATYVFLDLETSSIPKEDNNLTRITELSLVAVKREHVLDTRPGDVPRVQHKLTLCLNPGRVVQPTATDITGLCNNLLEHETPFNMQVFTIINNFLNVLTKPVCLIAQNGHNFDFPILKNHFERLNVSLTADILCADCLYAFYDITNKKRSNKKAEPVGETSGTVIKADNEQDLMAKNTLSMKSINETTPKSTPFTPRKEARRVCKAKKKLFYNEVNKPNQSYRLKDIYERLLNRPAKNAHRAETDCILALECTVVLAAEFVAWVDENSVLFTEVNAMTVGVPLGLLAVTGALWGCTNPFIRQGTKGLRLVSAGTWAGQAYAELAFLLGNWRYVAPWLVNQLGSLAYLAAVRRAPLSLAVPAANGLAFAFTALVGALLGLDQPLDTGSILGIVLIVAGTALCCWDKA